MLQFTAAGGMPSSQLLAGRHGELLLKAPAAGRRQYDEFSFRETPKTASELVATSHL